MARPGSRHYRADVAFLAIGAQLAAGLLAVALFATAGGFAP